MLLFFVNLACSQTLYFLLKVRQARVTKKHRGIKLPLAQGGRGGGKKRKQRVCEQVNVCVQAIFNHLL